MKIWHQSRTITLIMLNNPEINNIYIKCGEIMTNYSQILTSIQGDNSITNVQKIMRINPN